MTATMSTYPVTDDLLEVVGDGSEPSQRRGGFTVEVEHLGDAIRLARRVSALANPTTVALVSASVDDRVIFPASPETAPCGSVIQLTFATRDRSQPLEPAVVERLVAAIGGHGVVLAVHHQ